MGNGWWQWAVGSWRKQRTVDNGQWAVSNGQSAVRSGQWTVGQLAVGSRQWTVRSEQWKVDGDRGQWALMAWRTIWNSVSPVPEWRKKLTRCRNLSRTRTRPRSLAFFWSDTGLRRWMPEYPCGKSFLDADAQVLGWRNVMRYMLHCITIFCVENLHNRFCNDFMFSSVLFFKLRSPPF